jgi:hypothetical protein
VVGAGDHLGGKPDHAGGISRPCACVKAAGGRFLWLLCHKKLFDVSQINKEEKYAHAY